MGTIDYEALRAQIRSIAEEVIRPNAERVDAEGIFPRQNLIALNGRSRMSNTAFMRLAREL